MVIRSCYHPKLSDTFYRSSDFRIKNCYEKNLVEMLLDFSLTSKRNSNHCAWWPSPTFYVHISQWKNFINSNFLTEKVCEQKQFGYSPNLNYQVFGGIRLWSLQSKNAKLFAFEYTYLVLEFITWTMFLKNGALWDHPLFKTSASL